MTDDDGDDDGGGALPQLQQQQQQQQQRQQKELQPTNQLLRGSPASQLPDDKNWIGGALLGMEKAGFSATISGTRMSSARPAYMPQDSAHGGRHRIQGVHCSVLKTINDQ